MASPDPSVFCKAERIVLEELAKLIYLPALVPAPKQPEQYQSYGRGRSKPKIQELKSFLTEVKLRFEACGRRLTGS